MRSQSPKGKLAPGRPDSRGGPPRLADHIPHANIRVIKISNVEASDAGGRADSIALFHQGVTLTDLQEAEKTIGRGRPTKTREEEKEEREKQDKEKQEERKETETKEEDYRSKYRSFEEVRLSTPLSFQPDALKASSSPACSSPTPPPPLQRYRPLSSSSTSTSAISTASTASTPSYSSTTLSSSSLNRPNSLTGITSSYSRSSRDTEKGWPAQTSAHCFRFP